MSLLLAQEVESNTIKLGAPRKNLLATVTNPIVLVVLFVLFRRSTARSCLCKTERLGDLVETIINIRLSVHIDQGHFFISERPSKAWTRKFKESVQLHVWGTDSAVTFNYRIARLGLSLK